jgi:hypothetical protein
MLKSTIFYASRTTVPPESTTEKNLIADSPIGRISIFANGKDSHVLFLKEEARI